MQLYQFFRETTADIRNKWVTIIVAFIFILIVFRLIFPERSLNEIGVISLANTCFLIGIWLLTLFIALGVGVFVLRLLIHKNQITNLEKIIFAIPVGLGIISYGLLWMGFLGYLTNTNVVLWLLLLLIVGARDLRNAAHSMKKSFVIVHSEFIEGKLIAKLQWVTIFAILGFAFIQTLSPPWSYDALMYHLEGPKRFLLAGSIIPLEDIWQANGPMSVDILFIIGEVFQVYSFGKLIHFSFGVLLLFSVYALSIRIVPRIKGRLAVVVLVGIPVIPIWFSFAYNDLGWVLFEFLSIYMIVIWITNKQSVWLAISGLFMGLALGSKYLALGGVLIALGFVLWGIIENRSRDWKGITYFFLAIIIIGSPWYMKNLYVFGNPVFPAYFGGGGWTSLRLRLYNEYHIESFGVGRGIIDYLLLPWNIYAKYQVFTTFLGTIEYPSLIFPLVIFYPFLGRKNKFISIFFIASLVRFILWALSSQQIRFLLPIYPYLAIIIAYILHQIQENIRKYGFVVVHGLLSGVLIATLLFQILFLIKIQPISVVIGGEPKLKFLTRVIDGYSAISFINENLESDNRVLLVHGGQAYYCAGKCILDSDHTTWTSIVHQSGNIRNITYLLRNNNITHLLVTQSDISYILAHDPSGIHTSAFTFLLNEYRPNCLTPIYIDSEATLFELTCS